MCRENGDATQVGSLELRPLIFAGPRSFRARVASWLTLPGQEAEETLGGPIRASSSVPSVVSTDCACRGGAPTVAVAAFFPCPLAEAAEIRGK